MDPWWRLAALAGASVSAFLVVDAVATWVERRLRRRDEIGGRCTLGEPRPGARPAEQR